MIRGQCFTNIDRFSRVEWPTKFVAVPRVGDRVEGKGVNNSQPVLKVVSVTHVERDGVPYILVELHNV